MVSQKESNNFVFEYHSVFDFGKAEMSTFNRRHYDSAFSYHAVSFHSEDIDVTKEPRLMVLLRVIVTFLLYVVVITLFPITMWICIKRVHALERIVLIRLGHLQPVRGPGIILVLPFIDKWTRVNLRPQSFIVSTEQCLTADGGIIEAKSEIEYHVSDVVYYVTRLQEQEQTLKDLGFHCIVNLFSGKYQDDIECKRDILCATLKDELNRTVQDWGLEILKVYMHSVKVLKAAEPVNVVGTLVSALKSAAGQSSEHTAMFPFIPPVTVCNGKTETAVVEMVPEEDPVSKLKAVLQDANKKVHDLKANVLFDIVRSKGQIDLLCCFKNGKVSFSDDKNLLQPDVTVMLTEDNLRDFLSGRCSLVQSYFDGKLMVSGDWSLLRPLAKAFD